MFTSNFSIIEVQNTSHHVVVVNEKKGMNLSMERCDALVAEISMLKVSIFGHHFDINFTAAKNTSEEFTNYS